jgi:hypothetical protein
MNYSQSLWFLPRQYFQRRQMMKALILTLLCFRQQQFRYRRRHHLT